MDPENELEPQTKLIWLHFPNFIRDRSFDDDHVCGQILEQFQIKSQLIVNTVKPYKSAYLRNLYELELPITEDFYETLPDLNWKLFFTLCGSLQEHKLYTFDEQLDFEVLKRKRALFLNSANLFQEDDDLISSSDDVKKLKTIHLQGFLFYEFDQIDIYKGASFIICGVPKSYSIDDLEREIARRTGSDSVTVIQNSEEDPTCFRVNFVTKPEGDHFRKYELMLIDPETNYEKPIVIFDLVSRDFDYIEALKFCQVRVIFTGEVLIEEAHCILLSFEKNFGAIADVSFLSEKEIVVTFQYQEFAQDCLAQHQNFAEEYQIYRVARCVNYIPMNGTLWDEAKEIKQQIKTTFEYAKRPPKKLKSDPNLLKLKQWYFNLKGSNENMKKRYEKIYYQQKLKDKDLYSGDSDDEKAMIENSQRVEHKSNLELMIDELGQ